MRREELDDFRYERKFLIDGASLREVQHLLRRHPAIFSEIFHQRQINNIYMDTPGFLKYSESADGVTDREKVRIRWYGDLVGRVEKPVLEFKIRNGLVGRKNSFVLGALDVNDTLDVQTLIQCFDEAELPAMIRQKLALVSPVLLNCYVRQYFQSLDEEARVTLDSEMQFYRIGMYGNWFNPSPSMHRQLVLEVKYDVASEEQIDRITNLLPFRMTKYSKYVDGVDFLHFHSGLCRTM